MTHALPRSGVRGFTLIEVIIAIAVFAVFSALAYGALIQLLENRTRVEAERTFWREITLGFVRLQQDLALARNRPIRDVDGNDRAAFMGLERANEFLDEPRFEFTRGGVLTSVGATTDLQRIGYRLQKDELMRLAWPVLDRAPTTKAVAAPILRGVEAFDVRFYANGAWVDQWPPLGAGGNNQVPPLPEGVEVTVRIKGRGEYKRTFLVGRDK
jgi:general secretion pathway protein J